MEGSPIWELSMLQSVLIQGNEHMGELQAQLEEPCFSVEACKLLAIKVKAALSSAISMAKLLEKPTGFDSPTSASDSPRSADSEKASKELERREMSKKRKSLPRWSSQARAYSGSSMEWPADDGYSWRKYGQKDILGSKFPRSYYRCTYRYTHGCLAAKQVQRSDDDLSLFDITYRGAHTCSHGLQRNPSLSPKERGLDHNQDPKLQLHHHHRQEQQQLLLQYYGTGLTVKTEELSSDDLLPGSASFSFPSALPSCMNSDNNVFSKQQSQFTGNYSPTFVSSATSVESSMKKNDGELNLHGLDSEIAEIISAAASTTSSPLVEMDFLMEQIEFEADFQFGIS